MPCTDYSLSVTDPRRNRSVNAPQTNTGYRRELADMLQNLFTGIQLSHTYTQS